MRFAAIALVVFLAAACGAKSGSTDKESKRVVFESTSRSSTFDVDLDFVVSVMRKRLDELGVEDAQVNRDGDRIVVTLPNRRIDLAPVKQTGRLELFDLQGDLVPGVSLDIYGFPIPSPKPLKARPNTLVVTCGSQVRYCPGVQERPTRTYYYLFRYDPQNKEHPIPEMTGEDLQRKGTRADIDPSTSQPVVLMDFTKAGATKFENITRTLAERGRLVHNRIGGDDQNAFQQFAIVLDGKIKSAPTIDYNQNPSGIPGDNGAEIIGATKKEAEDLALVLRTGTLPFALKVVSTEAR